MAETQAGPTIGAFSWNELMTPDVEKAKSFYTQLFGWTTRDMDMGPNGTYTIWVNQGKDVGGCMKTPAEAGNVPPHWMGYVTVADVDAVAARVTQLGGKVHHPPTDIPDVGRFSVIADPTGAVISIITFKM